MKNGNHENCVFYTASELDKHIPDSPGQQLTMTGVAGLKEIEDGKLHRIASPASKAFNESRPLRLHHLMSLELPVMVHIEMHASLCLMCTLTLHTSRLS